MSTGELLREQAENVMDFCSGDLCPGKVMSLEIVLWPFFSLACERWEQIPICPRGRLPWQDSASFVPFIEPAKNALRWLFLLLIQSSLRTSPLIRRQYMACCDTTKGGGLSESKIAFLKTPEKEITLRRTKICRRLRCGAGRA